MALSETNQLLDSLSPQHRDRILSFATPVNLPIKTLLYETNETPKYAFFLTSGIASIVVGLEDGNSAEVGLIGREGVVGSLHLLGPAIHSSRCFVQLAGAGLRVPLAELKDAFNDSLEIRTRILEYVQYQNVTIMQIAACNKLHEAEARLARWLLMVQDRTDSASLSLTQEFLAQMLGTQRTTVAVAAGTLQKAGLITYSRGKVNILNREQFEEAACNCYEVIRKPLKALYQSFGR